MIQKAVYRLFSSAPIRSSSAALKRMQEKYNIKDENLERYLEEQVILVDKKDNEVGQMSLLESHLTENIFEKNLTHRAFSLLLFDDEYNLLLQKRSKIKIAFPEYWGNSCCSHPLANIPEEKETKDNLGARRAGSRRAM